jgi:glutaredoxin 2
MSTDIKVDPITKLTQVQQQLDALSAALADQGKAAEQKKASAQSASLTAILRELESQAITEWSQAQNDAIDSISKMAQALQSKVDSINQSIDIAQNIIQAFSVADQIVAKAKTMLTG